MKIKEILQKAILGLEENGVEEATNLARMLLAFVLKKEKIYLVINQEEEVAKDKEEEFKKGIKRLLEGEPIQYIIGKQEFMGIDFVVDKRVLIPQPDTEILVEKVIEICEKLKGPNILDLCTGSGAIAVSLNKFLKEAKITASDISKETLEIAKINEGLETSGYKVYKRDLNSEKYLLENIDTYFVDQNDNLYIVFAYGNNNYTSELDLVIF